MTPDAMTHDTATAATADGIAIESNMTVYVWDDLGDVPRLDAYLVIDTHDDGARLAGVAAGGGPRLRFALFDQCFADARTATLDGFRRGVEALAEVGDTFARPHRVGKSGVFARMLGGERPRWFGGSCPDLVPFVGHDVLVGRHDPRDESQVAVYDLGGQFICIAHRLGARGVMR